MAKTVRMLRSRRVLVIAALGLAMLGFMDIPAVEAQLGPETVCVLQIAASGEILSVLVDQPQNFNIAVLVPSGKKVNVPVTCDSLETLALAVANQKDDQVKVTTRVFTNEGELICPNGTVNVPSSGARGIVFSGCQ